MEHALIKISKALRVLRRDGISGVACGIAAILRPIRFGDILIITGGVGDSARYRAHHIAEELRFKGFRVSVAVTESPWLWNTPDRFSVFVFHRTLVTPAIAKLIARVKTRGKTIIFETDDLTFDPELFSKTDAYRQMNELERKFYEKGLGSEILNDPYVKTATTTTSFLADRLRERGKKVFVVPNRLSEEDVRMADEFYKRRSEREEPRGSSVSPRNNKLVLAYFSGTASHDRDFATIADPLLLILEKYADVSLAIHGPLSIDPRFEAFGERVRRMPYVPRADHWKNVANADINLAPLEIGDPFCEAKSELKFFEAGICGVPTVAAATRTFREAIRDGEDGFVAATAEEWTEKLKKLILNTGLRQSMGERARETALARYTTMRSRNEEYYQYLREILKG